MYNQNEYYKLLDAYGAYIKAFPTFQQADEFRFSRSRPDWKIVKVTKGKFY